VQKKSATIITYLSIDTMVVKKYLCAAPRPETWKEKAEKLLQSLGGDEAKRDAFVRQTLTKLRTEQYVPCE
jgi:hypothetical protein